MLYQCAYRHWPIVSLLQRLASRRTVIAAPPSFRRYPSSNRRRPWSTEASPPPVTASPAHRRTRSPGSRVFGHLRGGVLEAGMDCPLVWVQPESAVPEWRPVVRATAATAQHRLYAFFEGQPGSPAAVTTHTVSMLTELYDAVATIAPQLDVVPLLPACGWTLDRVAGIAELQSVAASSPSLENGLPELNRHRAEIGLPTLPLRHTDVEGEEGGRACKESTSTAADLRSAPKQSTSHLSFAHVAVGGTFDHLHAGHRLLLATAAAIASDTVWLGIASDSLLAKKTNAELLEGYDTREGNAFEFIQRVRPGVTISAGALTDPSEPPLAATMDEMGGLVVSRETISGADWINSHRESAGFEPIAVIVVGLIGADGQTAESTKLSSSALREARARKELAK